MAGFDRISALTEELGRIAKDLERGFARYGQVLNELQGIGLLTQLVVAKRGPGRPRRAANTPSAAPRRGHRRGGTLTQQVVDFLASKPGQSLLPRQIAAGMGLPDKRKKTLATTLFLLAKNKRVTKLGRGKGYKSAS
jgi:hypothetical protein